MQVASSHDDAPDDLQTLEDFDDNELLRCLRQRFERPDPEIFTWVGRVLVSVNPYRDIGVFGTNVVEQYMANLPCLGTSASSPVKPHLFAAVAGALAAEGDRHALLISGESGAGKTEATRAALSFLAKRCGTAERVRDRLLHGNPVLEAFGNAKTRQNGNSSRFGKFIEVHISPAGELVGATLRPYMLEVARVVGTLMSGEQTYHVFYQLRAAVSALASGQHVEHASCSAWAKVVGLSSRALMASPRLQAGPEAEDCLRGFQDLCSRLLCLGMSTAQLASCAEVVAAVGMLADDALTGTTEAMAAVADLLGTSDAQLSYFLDHVQTSVQCTGETLVRNRSDHDKTTLRASLAQELYGGLFLWMTTFVVSGITPPLGGPLGRRIGLLDIYGFEIFPSNGFEQMLINYANERIQELFNRQVFLREAQEYTAEGLDDSGEWKRLSAACCLPALKLLEGEAESRFAGVFGIVDDRSRCGLQRNGEDVGSLVKDIVSLAGKHESFRSPAKDASRVFGVKHFAGEVFYDASGFCRKNARAQRPDIVAFLRSHGSSFVRGLFAGEVVPSNSGNPRRVFGSTISSNFRTELNELCKTLEERECRHIRCLRPNDVQAPMQFDDKSILRQCRYSGLLEATRIRKYGYAHRRAIPVFVSRYGCLLGLVSTRSSAQGWTSQSIKMALQEIMQQRGMPADQVCVGYTKIFIKERALAWLEDLRVQAAATRISSWYRASWARRAVKVIHERRMVALLRLQAASRGFLARQTVKRIRLTRASELEIIRAKREREAEIITAKREREERVRWEETERKELLYHARRERSQRKRKEWQEISMGLPGSRITAARRAVGGRSMSPRIDIECSEVPTAMRGVPGRIVACHTRSSSGAPSNAPPSSPRDTPPGSPATSCRSVDTSRLLSPPPAWQERSHVKHVNYMWQHSLRSTRGATLVRPVSVTSRPSRAASPAQDCEAMALAALEQQCRSPVVEGSSSLSTSMQDSPPAAALPEPPKRSVRLSPRQSVVPQVEAPPLGRSALRWEEPLGFQAKENNRGLPQENGLAAAARQRSILGELSASSRSQSNLPAQAQHKKAISSTGGSGVGAVRRGAASPPPAQDVSHKMLQVGMAIQRGKCNMRREQAQLLHGILDDLLDGGSNANAASLAAPRSLGRSRR